MRIILSSTLALSLALHIPLKARAIPAAVVAPAVCVGTAGIGCILVGSAVVGGIVYYAWQNTQTKKRIITKKNGQIVKILDDPEEENSDERQGDSGVWDEPIYSPTEEIARAECKNLARLYNVKLVDVKFDGKTFRCYFRG